MTALIERRRARRIPRLGAVIRKGLWRSVFTATGGLTVSGTLPDGPAVLVANHGSHADTAALLAALPADRRPVAAAAADYWFDVRWRRILIQSLAAALPVRRGTGGAYRALADAAGPVLTRGDLVIVFAEGTRTPDGQLGEFKTGALRLAAEFGVPIVPIGLDGTREILPKHGRISPRRVEVRIGAGYRAGELAVDAAGAAQLRSDVEGLLSPSRLWPPLSVAS